MPPINLLPPELRAEQRVRRILTIAGAAALVVLLFLVVVFFAQRNTIGNEEERLSELQAQAAQLRADVARLQEFGLLKQEVDTRRQTLAAALDSDVAWSKLLNDISLIMPDNSWLTSLGLTAAVGTAPTGEPSLGTTTFQGFVFDFPGLAGWLTRLSQVEGLTFVYLTTGAKADVAGRAVVSFGANASVTQPLLSGRCQEGQPCP